MPAEHLPLAVSAQDGAQGSLMEAYRAFLAFRARHPALVKGDIAFLDLGPETLAFTRSEGTDRILCVFNMSRRRAEIALPGEAAGARLLGEAGHFGARLEAGQLHLARHGAAFLQLD